MSDIIKKFKIFSKISEELKENMKLFEAIDEYNVLFVTNADNVYGFGHNNRTIKEPEILPELSSVKVKQFIAGVNFVLAINQSKHKTNTLFTKSIVCYHFSWTGLQLGK